MSKIKNYDYRLFIFRVSINNFMTLIGNISENNVLIRVVPSSLYNIKTKLLKGIDNTQHPDRYALTCFAH